MPLLLRDLLYVPPEFHKASMETPKDATSTPSVELEFDGNSLHWIEDGKVVKSWPAESGRPGFQSERFEHLKDQGPLPRGAYTVRQSDFQKIEDISLSNRLLGIVGRGTWPGLETSWGRYRVWLIPTPGMATYGRDDFSIHGGAVPGSAGCIDLTSRIEDFINTFQRHGRDLQLRVIYPPATGAR